jgi:GntR family transcriptional regulator
VTGGSPGLSVLRQYVSTRDEVFEVSLSIHPADRYHYTMQLDLSLGRHPVGVSEPG